MLRDLMFLLRGNSSKENNSSVTNAICHNSDLKDLWHHFSSDYIDTGIIQAAPEAYLDERVAKLSQALDKASQDESIGDESLILEILDVVAEFNFVRNINSLNILKLIQTIKLHRLDYDGSPRPSDKSWKDSAKDLIDKKNYSSVLGIEIHIGQVYKDFAKKYHATHLFSNQSYQDSKFVVERLDLVMELIDREKIKRGRFEGLEFEVIKSNQIFKDLYQEFVSDFKEKYFYNVEFNDRTNGAIREMIPERYTNINVEELNLIDIKMIFDACAKSLIVGKMIERGYLQVLAIKQKQLIYRDEYGDFQCDDWYREVEKFVSKKYSFLESSDQLSNSFHNIANMLSITDDLKQDPSDLVFLITTLSDEVFGRSDEIESPGISFSENLEPAEYEIFVSELVETAGWTAALSGKSGDQGVDVVAIKGQMKIAIQCKLYSQPVGNSAVQEVHSGAGYYKAHLGIVVTNSKFTKSAMQLADSLGVRLLHHNQLQNYLQSFE